SAIRLPVSANIRGRSSASSAFRPARSMASSPRARWPKWLKGRGEDPSPGPVGPPSPRRGEESQGRDFIIPLPVGERVRQGVRGLTPLLRYFLPPQAATGEK